MDTLLEEIDPPHSPPDENDSQGWGVSAHKLTKIGQQGVSIWKDYFDSLHVSGAVYTFRTFKARIWWHDFRQWCRPRGHFTWRILLPIIAGLPVTLGFITGFYTLWRAVPDGFSCRHWWLIDVYISWIFSAAITTITNSLSKNGNTLWWVILAKDSVFGLASLLMVFLSATGLYNSCRCWSLNDWLGWEDSYLPLNSDPEYVKRDKGEYLIIVFVCIGLQVAIPSLAIIFLRHGLAVMRWGEGHKREEWAKWMKTRAQNTLTQNDAAQNGMAQNTATRNTVMKSPVAQNIVALTMGSTEELRYGKRNIFVLWTLPYLPEGFRP